MSLVVLGWLAGQPAVLYCQFGSAIVLTVWNYMLYFERFKTTAISLKCSFLLLFASVYEDLNSVQVIVEKKYKGLFRTTSEFRWV